MKRTLAALVFAVVMAFPLTARAQVGTGSAPGAGSVVIWQIERDGFPTIRHAWKIGTDVLLKVTWDNGATWYGFRPFAADREKGRLSVRGLKKAIVDGAETWAEKFSITVVNGNAGRIGLGSEGGSLHLRVSLNEFRDGAASRGPVEAAGPDRTPDKDHCCVTCGTTTACNCSVCLVECHTACCVGGCDCLTC